MPRKAILHRAAFRELATSPEAYGYLLRYGVRIKARASSTAPKANGEYASSFFISTGRHDNRAVIYVGSSHEAAAHIEWGVADLKGRAWYGPTPAHHTMAAAFWAVAPR